MHHGNQERSIAAIECFDQAVYPNDTILADGHVHNFAAATTPQILAALPNGVVLDRRSYYAPRSPGTGG